MSHCQGYTCKTIIDDGISCSKISCTYKQNRIKSDSSFFCGWTNLLVERYTATESAMSVVVTIVNLFPSVICFVIETVKIRVQYSDPEQTWSMKRSNHKVYISIKFPIKGLKCFIHEWASDSHFTCAQSVWWPNEPV